MEEDKLYCPFCGSSQLTANKKGFGAGKALTGVVITGGIGLLAGFIGSGNIKVTCLKCGCQWKPGELKTNPLTENEKQRYYEHIKKVEEEKKKQYESSDFGFGCLFIILLFIIIMICILV